MPAHVIDLSSLPSNHRSRLQWFATQAGANGPLPDPSADGSLVMRPKGIYKPAGLAHALSVRIMVSSPYADKVVETKSDGSWSLQYFQENPDPAQKMREYTNRGLDRCQRDRVPVGVLVQTNQSPARYDVIRLALVVSWDAGFFALESARPA